MPDVAAALLAGGILALAFGAIIIYVLTVVACWCIYSKAGQPGWKSLIPIYNMYILYKISWKTGMFSVMVLIVVIGSFMIMCDPGVTTQYVTENANIVTNDHSSIYYGGQLLLIVSHIINALCYYHVGRSFGHGLPFFIMSLFLPNIALLILGFSRDQYRGNMTTQR